MMINCYKIDKIVIKMNQIYWVGIRRQNKSVWQRRAPLSPTDLSQIQNIHKDIRFIVQPSSKRVYSDYQYQKNGAILDQDLSKCSLILGKYFRMQGQLQNMPALDHILANKIRLIDYQKITDQKNQRLIAFGKYAGMAGAIDFLKGLGQYMMQMGQSTPFLHCNVSYKYFDVKNCYDHLRQIGNKIKEQQIPKQLSPMIFAITGRGRTAVGCLQVLQNLPITKISPDKLAQICKDKDNPIHRKTIYLTTINTQDCIQNRDPDAKFDKEDFYKNPSKYRCTFKTKYLPYISALFHCIYWDSKFPKYIKNKHLYNLASTKNLRLLGICDVTCDLDGSIECLKQYTSIQQPFFYYDSLNESQTKSQKYKYGKIMYLGIDFLPCQLALDASNYFSIKLKGWIQNIVKSNKNKQLQEQGLLPQLKRAVIAYNNKLAPNFEYIQKMREQNMNKSYNTLKKIDKNLEYDKTASVLQNNVTIITDIKGQALDFSQ